MERNKIKQAGWISSILSLFKGNDKESPIQVSLYYLQTEVLAETSAFLRSYFGGHDYHEGIVYWAGFSTGNVKNITTCIAQKAKTTRGSFSTNIRDNAKVISFINKYGLQIIAQVHSHPGINVNHSEGDNDNAFMPYDGFLSVVVPQYGSKGMMPLNICGIHIFENGKFRRLINKEIEYSFRIVPLSKDMRYKAEGVGMYV